jgi:transposase
VPFEDFMLTHYTDDDLDKLVKIFEFSCEARGAKGRNNRLFIESLLYFSKHSISWRALPLEFGHWNTTWRRFSRLSKNGTFERMFEVLSSDSEAARLAQMIDSTVVRAHVSAAGAKGGKKIRV